VICSFLSLESNQYRFFGLSVYKMYLLFSLSCTAQLQYTTNWSASVIEHK
jgi:hypothetical protein